MAGIIVVLVVLVVAVAVFSFARGTAADTEFLLFEIVFLVFLGAAFGDAYLATRVTELVVRVAGNGVEAAAGRYSLVVPWSSVERLWVVHGGSRCPILCVGAGDLSHFAPKGIGWRLKAFANRRMFGTPLVTPLVNTGLSESGLLDAARSYHQSDGATNGRPVVAVGDSTEPQSFPPSRGFRNGLVAGLGTVALVLVGVAWLAAIALVRSEPVPSEVAPEEANDALWTVAALALALAATLGVTQAATRVYHAIVPLGDAAGRFPQPVLRVGPQGVEHIIRGKSRRLPWPAVRRFSLAVDRSGSRIACVTTADPLALVPPVRNWSANAKQNEQKYGAPVAVSLAGSGLTEEDLLNAVRHYSEGRVAVG